MSDHTEELGEVVWVRAACRTGEARELRERANASLEEIGRSCGVGPSTIHRWETGQRNPRHEGALRYAASLRLIERLVAAA